LIAGSAQIVSSHFAHCLPRASTVDKCLLLLFYCFTGLIAPKPREKPLLYTF
jgi:hypothetical protein